ncbi:MAG: LolA family protein, partial [Candidatus Puniceispirillaceae bacterium]
MRLSIITYLAPIIGMLMMALHPASAQPASQQEIIARAEQALSDMKTMQADFIQFSSDGSVGEGRIYFRRPHQLRIDYL